MTKVRRRRWLGGSGLAALALVGVAIGLDRALPPPLDRGAIVSSVVTDREGRTLRAFPVEDGRWRLAADLDRLDPAFVRAVIAVEDKRFYKHGGVDFQAALRAIADTVRRGEIHSGASTITMQTARLLEPRDRTLRAKIIECLRAWQIERRLSKDEILELYLTLAPYGGNLEGVRSATYAWFGREPEALTPDQIALLVALPQAPEARRPDRRPEAAREARAAILMQMTERGLLAADRAADAAAEAVPSGRADFPAMAWHAADRAAREGHGTVTTTLDFALQRRAEDIVRQAAAGAPPSVQFAALIIENDGRAVRALAGSAGRDRPGGWLDLTARKRSPGSTLKPFVYALAFDDGTAAPDTLIRDLPARFAAYRPENFDRTFRGEVSVAAALQHSLNVPAVRVLDTVGANRFVSALNFAGVKPVLPRGGDVDVGLAVALGGVGLSVQDIAVLYAALGDGGRAKPLALTPEAADRVRAASATPLVSAESAEEIRAILEQSPPPPGRIPPQLTTGALPIAFKTGTSYGFRDAWAAGTGGGFTVVVWTGHADGTPRPGTTGREAALPLLFDLFDAVVRHSGTKVRPAPRALDRSEGPMARFSPADAAPEILFPPEGAEVWSDDTERGFVLSARGRGPFTWYADGEPVPVDVTGTPVWTPGGPGFFELAVFDPEGRSSRSRVRVRMPG